MNLPDMNPIAREPVVSLDLSGAVIEANPSGTPFEQTEYYQWLVDNAPEDVSRLVHKFEYMGEKFGFVVGQHNINANAARTLNWIEDAWFADNVVKTLAKAVVTGRHRGVSTAAKTTLTAEENA